MRSLALAFAVLATSAVAQERPPEEEIFGAPKEARTQGFIAELTR